MQYGTQQLAIHSHRSRVPGGPQEDECKGLAHTSYYIPFNLERRTSIGIYLLVLLLLYTSESEFPLHNLWWYIRISYYLNAATLVKLMVSPHAESHIPCVQPLNQFFHSDQQFATVQLAILHFMILLFICSTIHSTHVDRGS